MEQPKLRIRELLIRGGKAPSPPSMDKENLEYHKARMKAEYPAAYCIKSELSWDVFINLDRKIPFASAQTEEWAWERASVSIAYMPALEALQTTDDWLKSHRVLSEAEAPLRAKIKKALALAQF